MFRHCMIALLLGSMFAISAAAAPFPGWERRLASDNIALISPPDQEEQRVAFVFSVVEPVKGSVNAWFKKTVASAISDLGAVKARTGIRRQESALIEVVRSVRPEDGFEIDAMIAAYPVSGGYASMALIYPSAIADTDARVVVGLDFIATALRTKYALKNASRFDATAPAARQMTTVQTRRQVQPTLPPQPATGLPNSKCRKPIWGLHVSPWCQPSGICNDLVIKGYEDC